MTTFRCPATARARGASLLGLGLIVFSLLCGAQPIHAAEVYTLVFDTGLPVTFTGPTALHETRDWGVPEVFHAEGWAGPGSIRMIQQVADPAGGAYGTESRASASADDFLITGPSGPTVTGTMHFRASVTTSRSGGSDTASTGAGGWLTFTWVNQTQPITTDGECHDTGGGYSGTGFLSTFVPPGGTYDTSLTADFPVGVPFNIVMTVSASGAVYTLPADVQADLSGEIGDVTGHVIDLPPDYALASAEWSISDNTAVEAATWGSVKALYR